VGCHLRQVVELEGQGPDPRDSNTHYRIDPTLTIIAMTLLVGRREIAAIARFATTLAQPQRRRLGLPFKKGPRLLYIVPAYDVSYPVCCRRGPEAFATHLSTWLSRRAGGLPQALALDDRMIRDQVGLLTPAQHEDGGL